MDEDFKKDAPAVNSSALSTVIFTHTFPLFAKGRRKDLDEEDIPTVLKDHEAFDLGDKLETLWNNQVSTKRPSLWGALVRLFGTEYLILAIGLFFDEIVLRMLRPVALSQLIRYFTETKDGNIGVHEAYTYGAIIVITSLLSVFSNHFCGHNLFLLGLKAKVACTSLIYRKCLKLSKSALGDVTIGHITNLVSNDLNRFNTFALHTHYIWIAPLQVVIIACIVYYAAGPEATVGLLLMVLIVPIQVFVGKKCSDYRLRIALRTDERIRIMSEIITGIKVIKMYTWEEPFTRLMKKIRGLEMNEIKGINHIKGFIKFLLITPKVAIFLAVAVYMLTGNNVTATYVFVIASFYDGLKISLTINFVYGTNVLAETLVSIRRVRAFLLLDEQTKNEKRYSHLPFKKKLPLVELQAVSAKWSKADPHLTLNGVSLKVEGCKLIGIVGHVGSGKSSILHAIMEELILEGGSVNVQGRIAYASQEAWVFSGSIQQNILFGKPMEPVLYGKVLQACALEQDLEGFQYGDQTLVGEKGMVLSGGQKARVNLARALYTGADIYLLDDPLSAVDIHVGKYLFDHCIRTFLSQKCVILVTHQMQYLDVFDCVYIVDGGKISQSGTYKQLKESDTSIIHQLFASKKDETASSENDALSEPTNLKELVSVNPLEKNEEQRSTGKISKDTFIFFITSAGSTPLVVLLLIVFVLSQFTFSASDYFLAYWVIEEQKKIDTDYVGTLSEADFAYTYTGLILVMTFSTILRSYIFFKWCTKASTGLHHRMFTSVINTPMSFFYNNNSGRILNRFTKDIGIVDEAMPMVFNEIMQIFLTVLGIMIMICLANPWLIISSAICMILVYCLRAIYAPTGRSLVRLEGTARSPVFFHVSETLQGLTTIRASKSQAVLLRQFDGHQDLHTSTYSTYLNCSRALAFYCDLLCVLYLASTVFVLASRPEQSAGNVGLAITQSFSLLHMLQWGLQQTCEFETQMTSVERIADYSNLESEASARTSKPFDNWPALGNMRFVSLSLRYGPEAPHVLKNINLSIRSKEKVGVVGRTGAGKTSLLTALFQLSHTEGTVFIDDVDITKLSMHSLRSKISIIPQDPVLFYGTVRSNLDPFKIYTDPELWAALEQVELKGKVSQLQLGLEHVVSDGGSNFSVGQRQLICLARAFLRKNTILVVDEATANVDPYTDTLIQNTIRKNFLDCTVITIAHRLNTIMDSDKVAVMDAGEIVEYDHPHLLLQNHDGEFYSMVHRTGPQMANTLEEVADDSYKSKVTGAKNQL